MLQSNYFKVFLSTTLLLSALIQTNTLNNLPEIHQLLPDSFFDANKKGVFQILTDGSIVKALNPRCLQKSTFKDSRWHLETYPIMTDGHRFNFMLIKEISTGKIKWATQDGFSVTPSMGDWGFENPVYKTPENHDQKLFSHFSNKTNKTYYFKFYKEIKEDNYESLNLENLHNCDEKMFLEELSLVTEQNLPDKNSKVNLITNLNCNNKKHYLISFTVENFFENDNKCNSNISKLVISKYFSVEKDSMFGIHLAFLKDENGCFKFAAVGARDIRDNLNSLIDGTFKDYIIIEGSNKLFCFENFFEGKFSIKIYKKSSDGTNYNAMTMQEIIEEKCTIKKASKQSTSPSAQPPRKKSGKSAKKKTSKPSPRF